MTGQSIKFFRASFGNIPEAFTPPFALFFLSKWILGQKWGNETFLMFIFHFP
jgi:hypothetical protein